MTATLRVLLAPRVVCAGVTVTVAASVAVLAGTLAIFIFNNFIELMKSGAKMIAAVVTIFASGFQKSPEVPGPSIMLSPLLMGIAITFVAIFASVFTPGPEDFPAYRRRDGQRPGTSIDRQRQRPMRFSFCR